MTFVKLFLNAMIRNIKIHNFLILLKIKNLWNLINVFIKKTMKIFTKVFPMIFQSSMGPKKSRSDILNGTTQRCFHPSS
jgi:hypothetical protein